MRNINNSKLRIIPLGGLEQIGMNITAFEFEDSIVVVDCGLSFPEDDMLGIDLVIPDITYLKENIEKVKGFVITHGHEDHIGALPYVLKEINVPIYATKLTIGLIENKLREHELHSPSIWAPSGSSSSRRTTASWTLPPWRSTARRASWCIRETLRWIIRRYSAMPSTCSASARSERRACWL